MKTNKTSALLFVFMLACFALPFRTVLYDDSLTRLDLAFALALDGTTRIDGYHANTIDKAFVKGHYYCDKAPGLSLAAVPVVAALRPFFPPGAFRPDNPVVHYVLAMLLVAVPSALSVAVFFRLAAGLTKSNAGAAAVAAAWGAGTIALPYSTLFTDHQFAASLVVFALALLWPAFEEDKDLSTNSTNSKKGTKGKTGTREHESTRTLCRTLAAGFLLGWAVVSEYPAAVSAAVVAGCFVVAVRRRSVFWLLPGLVFSAGVLAFYNTVSFGGPFSIGYQHEAHGYFREGMGAGLAGVTLPKAGALAAILFRPERGLLWCSPFLVFGAVGLITMLRRREKACALGVICLLIVALRVMVVAGYYEPWGGFAAGSRFLTGALPFLVLPAAVWWGGAGPGWRRLFAALCFFSAAGMFAMNVVEPRAPFAVNHPLMEYAAALIGNGFEPASALRFAGFGFPAEWIAGFAVLAVLGFALARSAGAWDGKTALLCVTVASVLFAFYYGVAKVFPSRKQDQAAYYVGVALRQNGKHGAAEKQLRRAVALAERPFPAAHFALGITHVRLEDFAAAEEDFAAAIDGGADDPRPHISLAFLYIMEERFTEAEKILDDGLVKFPTSPELNDLMKKLRGAGKTEDFRTTD